MHGKYVIHIPETSGYLHYSKEVEPEFLARFTEFKQKPWGPAARGIDDYVAQRFLVYVEKCIPQTAYGRRMRTFIQRPALRDRALDKINGQFNKGLAAIALDPKAQITHRAPKSGMSGQGFEAAMRLFLTSFWAAENRIVRTDDLNNQIIQARDWSDSCINLIYRYYSENFNRARKGPGSLH